MSGRDDVNRWYKSDRLGGLRRFAAAITLLNVAGHFFLGFEPSWAAPLVAIASAYSLEIVLELVDARAQGRRVRFAGGVRTFVDFLLPAHISAMAVSMLLYSNQSLGPVIFGAAVAIASKAFFRARVDGTERHIFNPSNFGIASTLLCFHWVGIAPPYMFTENLGTVGDFILPSIIITLGTLLNTKFTRRLPLIAAWLSTFVLQGATRHFLLGQPFVSTLLPMTGLAFMLFTFYMVTDPPTTPSSTRGQVLFGASVALVYGLLMVLHVVFGLFFSLAIVSSVRALWLWSRPVRASAAPAHVSEAALAEVALAAHARAVSKKPLPAHPPEVVRES